MPMNVIRVLKADGSVTQLSTNIHLDEICHTEDVLEITQIGKRKISFGSSNV